MHTVNWIVLVLLVVAAANGLWSQGAYDDFVSPERLPLARGQDLLCLVLAPVLLLVAGRAGAGSVPGLVVWIAALAYVAYAYAGRAFGGTYNGYFPVYVALTSTATFAAAWLLLNLDAAAFAGRFRRPLPTSAVATFLVGTVVVLAPIRLWEIAEAIGARQAPEPGAVYVLDFAFVFPLFVLAAIWLWRGSDWGTVWAGIWLVWAAVLGSATSLGLLFAYFEGVSAGAGLSAFFVAFTLAGWILGWSYLDRATGAGHGSGRGAA